jgi:putative copper resistance protein D
MDPLLIATRALHFAGALSLLGVIGFTVLVAREAAAIKPKLRLAAQLSAALMLVTAPLWLVSVGKEMSSDTLAFAISSGVAKTALLDTQFGHALCLRVILTLCLLPLLARLGENRRLDAFASTIAAASVAAIAWQGHAGAELGRDAAIHLSADAAHLIAAGLWVGALLPLVLLLRAPTGTSGRYEAAKRFSTLGVACVALLLPSGIVNAHYLVGSVPALIGTAYGQVLLLKLALVLTMLALAAMNRWRFVPRLAGHDNGAARRIVRHTAIEGALGLGVIAIVAALGTMEPAMDEPVVWPFGASMPAASAPAMPHMH